MSVHCQREEGFLGVKQYVWENDKMKWGRYIMANLLAHFVLNPSRFKHRSAILSDQKRTRCYFASYPIRCMKFTAGEKTGTCVRSEGTKY